ncbi:MAG: metalloregulator ArsR/SmtB family transcription factor [Treponema sp.]|nr:metalloregulator ArsR/SmtB family transcription factor [Treponema sp.]
MEFPSLPHIHGHEGEHNDFVARELSKTKSFEAAGSSFALLSDPSRLKIFWFLCHVRDCVVNIADAVEMTTPAVSHHLKLLKSGGLIEGMRIGKEVFYRAADTRECRVLHKMIEMVLSISCPDFGGEEKVGSGDEHPETHVKKIKDVHNFLVDNLDTRFTIEELAKKFYMNPTTLKAVFKSVYGVSIATHINRHRMEKGAELLVASEKSIAEISRDVGYESQSKFTQAFKSVYGLSPTEYRSKNKVSVD